MYIYTYTDPFTHKRKYLYSKDLRSTSYTNYTYIYDHFVRESFGRNKVGDIKYSDVLHFYLYLVKEKGIQVNILETVHSVLHPTFQMSVRDDIIRSNPSEGVMAQVKKKCNSQNRESQI